jgi:hypothetical protein
MFLKPKKEDTENEEKEVEKKEEEEEMEHEVEQEVEPKVEEEKEKKKEEEEEEEKEEKEEEKKEKKREKEEEEKEEEKKEEEKTEKEEEEKDAKEWKQGEGEDVYAQRRQLVEAVCAAYGDRLRAPLRKYNGRLRYETAHGFMYCENYKIGSTAWAVQVLAMNGVNITAGEVKGTLP